jgi:thiol-disulfide isomerase/thioredoxin
MLLAGFSAQAQKTVALQDDTVTAPYLKYKDLPAFDAEYLNGKDTFNTFNIKAGTPTMIIYFSPDCDHCQEMIDAFMPRMNEMKKVDVYFMTWLPLVSLKIFNSMRHLENYPNVRFIGRDYTFFFPTFYGVSSVPNVVLYDKDKKYVKLWASANVNSIPDIISTVNNLK